MNQYQKKVHQKVKIIKKEEFRKLEEKYPWSKSGTRSINCMMEWFDIDSKLHYRQLRLYIRNKAKISDLGLTILNGLQDEYGYSSFECYMLFKKSNIEKYIKMLPDVYNHCSLGQLIDIVMT